MGKFKVGDKVRRTVVDFADCVVGEIYTISALKEGFLLLEGKGFQGGYDPACFELVEDIVEEPKFKVGDKVEIVYTDRCCAEYDQKASELGLVNWKDGAMPAKGEVGYVVVISPHYISFYGNVYAVQTNTNCYLMLEDGIAPVKSQKEKEREALLATADTLADQLNKFGYQNVYFNGELAWTRFAISESTLVQDTKAVAQLMLKLCEVQEKLDKLNEK